MCVWSGGLSLPACCVLACASQGGVGDSGGECNVPYTYRCVAVRCTAGHCQEGEQAEGSKGTGVNRQSLGIRAGALSSPTQLISSRTLPTLFSTPLRYYNPGPGDLLDPRSSYYSFTMGPVFFLILDSESETHATSPQVRDLGGYSPRPASGRITFTFTFFLKMQKPPLRWLLWPYCNHMDRHSWPAMLQDAAQLYL